MQQQILLKSYAIFANEYKYLEDKTSKVVVKLILALFICNDREVIGIVEDNSSASIIIIGLSPTSSRGKLTSKVFIFQSKWEAGECNHI